MQITTIFSLKPYFGVPLGRKDLQIPKKFPPLSKFKCNILSHLRYRIVTPAPRATQYKCCPPIREKDNQEELWAAVLAGHIDMIVSDHSPCTPDLKLPGEKDFMAAWGGISSLQFGLSLFWSQSVRDRPHHH